MRTQARKVIRPLARRLAGSIYGVRTQDPVIALTFDDGPDEDDTPRILDALADYGAHATFFILGERARRYPDLVRRIRAAGHEVGSHSDVHRRLTSLPLHHVLPVVRRGKRDLERVLGEPIRFFRPPYGFLGRRGYLAARSQGLDIVAWSAEAQDWLELEVNELVANSFRDLRPGGILLLHERYEPPQRPNPPPAPTFDRELFLKTLLDEISARGWKSVSVGELVSGRPIDRRLWFRAHAPAHSGQS
jgi:peptidoglycan/xylan/chitin deacetylase (PgdA/CDA1 family)